MGSDETIALFSGAGGLSLGFSRAGLPPDASVEINADACATYRENQRSPCYQHDLTQGMPPEASITRNCLALVGGPPCQGFSTAGARDGNDPRNRLIFSYLEIVAKIQPRWFLFENVEGLLTSNNGESVALLVEQFVRLGYWVRLEKINFAALGLPQARKRVIIMGNRVGLDFAFPCEGYRFKGIKHQSQKGSKDAPSLGEALAGLPRASAVENRIPYSQTIAANAYDSLMRRENTLNTVTLHRKETSDSDAEKLKLLLAGQSMKDLPEEQWTPSFRSRRFRRVEDGVPTENRGGPPAGIKRLVNEHVALTITSAASREFGHPTEHRMLTLRECARLQSFPDSYAFCGSRDSIATQIGNAFPPLVSEVFARAILAADGGAGTGMAKKARGKPSLLGYRLTEATAMSPVLKETDRKLAKLCGHTVSTQVSFFTLPSNPYMQNLTLAQKKLITKSRTAKPISLTDRELARLVSVMLHDLRMSDLIPDFCRMPTDYQSYYGLALDWFRSDEQRPFRFDELYLKCVEKVENFETIFACLAELHKRRRKFELILKTQPLPTMDQVGRKGLLEFGIVKSPALTSWLVWRKWFYDIDNRSAQETGYLFEPIMAAALGGVSYGARKSPIKRQADGNKGRQVDCLVDAGGEKLAYEFKLRMTIAASGQGRFREELQFPADAAASGFKPMLLVLDPTRSDKLTDLVSVFEANGGQALMGQPAWDHIALKAGHTMTAFIEKFVRLPIQSIDDDSDVLHGMQISLCGDGQSISLKVGEASWTITRSIELAPVEDDDESAQEG